MNWRATGGAPPGSPRASPTCACRSRRGAPWGCRRSRARPRDRDPPAAAANGDRADVGAVRGLDVVGRVAHHEGRARLDAQAIQRGLDGVGIGLRRRHVVRARALVDELAHAGQVEQRIELGLRGRAGDAEAHAVAPQALEQLADAREGREVRQVDLAEELEPARRDLAAELAVRRDARHARQQLVAPHADERDQRVHVALDLELTQGLRPRRRVGVVAVDQRAVDVEDERALREGHLPKMATDPGPSRDGAPPLMVPAAARHFLKR